MDNYELFLWSYIGQLQSCAYYFLLAGYNFMKFEAIKMD